MKKKFKLGKIHIIIVVFFAACILANAWYTRPVHIEDEIVIVNVENGESHQLKLDLYRKKSFVRTTVFYGSVWVDDVEYTASYQWMNPVDCLLDIPEKISEVRYGNSNALSGVRFTEKGGMLMENYVLIADYGTKDCDIRLALDGEACTFSTGTYLDEEAAKRWLSGGAE